MPNLKWHKLCKRTHAKWHKFLQNQHKFRQNSDHLLSWFLKRRSRQEAENVTFWAATEIAGCWVPCLRLLVKAACKRLNNIERICKFSIRISRNSWNTWWMVIWLFVDRNITKMDGPFSMNPPKPWMLKASNVSQRKMKTKYLESREDNYWLLRSMCCDRKEIECKMWTGSTQFMISLAKDASSQFKQNLEEARISFCLFRAFPKFRSYHRDFSLFGVKWYISSALNGT